MMQFLVTFAFATYSTGVAKKDIDEWHVLIYYVRETQLATFIKGAYG